MEDGRIVTVNAEKGGKTKNVFDPFGYGVVLKSYGPVSYATNIARPDS